MPTANGQTASVEHASDADFQAWVEANDLADLVDENGIAEWSFDDRCRTINFAIRRGKVLQFAGETVPAEKKNNPGQGIVSELFVVSKPAPPDGAA